MHTKVIVRLIALIIIICIGYIIVSCNFSQKNIDYVAALQDRLQDATVTKILFSVSSDKVKVVTAADKIELISNVFLSAVAQDSLVPHPAKNGDVIFHFSDGGSETFKVTFLIIESKLFPEYRSISNMLGISWRNYNAIASAETIKFLSVEEPKPDAEGRGE